MATRAGLSEDSAWSALRQLSDAGLLDGALPARSTHSRRTLLRRGLSVGAAGLAATAMVHTITAPAAAQAGSTCEFIPCESSLECCPDYFCCCVSAGCTQHFCAPGLFCEGV